LHDLPAFVVSTLWADAMLQPGFLAVWTEGRLRRSQRIMRTPLAASCF
jgi:hypothetical protein